MSKTLDCPAMSTLPEHPQGACDVCGHAPLGSWLRGFGCEDCRGAEAMTRAHEMAFGNPPREPLS